MYDFNDLSLCLLIVVITQVKCAETSAIKWTSIKLESNTLKF